MMNRRFIAAIYIFFFSLSVVNGENFRTLITGNLGLSSENAEGQVLALSYIDSVLIQLWGGERFIRGIELDLKVPQGYQSHRGTLAVGIYSRLDKTPEPGVADIWAERAGFELIPNKLQAVYYVPIRTNHGLKSSPYVSIPTGVIPPEAFPILFRIMPVIKGIHEEIEALRFQLTAKPILSDEGGFRLSLSYPEQLKDKPMTLRIDDMVIDDYTKEQILKEGEHHLVIVSDDYRNESHHFIIERGKVSELSIQLQDTIPIISFEAPENTEVFFDGTQIPKHREPFLTEPGEHEVRFQVGDYSLLKQLLIRKGKTYRIALTIDVQVEEQD